MYSILVPTNQINFYCPEDLSGRIDSIVDDKKNGFESRSDFICKAINKYFDLLQGNIFFRFYQYAGVQFFFFIIMVVLSWILQNIYIYMITGLVGVLLVGLCFGFLFRYAGVRWLK